MSITSIIAYQKSFTGLNSVLVDPGGLMCPWWSIVVIVVYAVVYAVAMGWAIRKDLKDMGRWS
jgi:hypothetical protein